MTAARYGVMPAVDETGAPQGSVFSSVTPEEQRQLARLARQGLPVAAHPFQAGAIANDRTYSGGQQARADLAALVEISPVGVVAFDAASGRVVSLNREARRIVESLRTAGRPAERLLEVITFLRADGRVATLGGRPLARSPGTGETVRAGEVELLPSARWR